MFLIVVVVVRCVWVCFFWGGCAPPRPTSAYAPGSGGGSSKIVRGTGTKKLGVKGGYLLEKSPVLPHLFMWLYVRMGNVATFLYFSFLFFIYPFFFLLGILGGVCVCGDVTENIGGGGKHILPSSPRSAPVASGGECTKTTL